MHRPDPLSELSKAQKVVCDLMALAIFSDEVMTKLVELKATLERVMSDLQSDRHSQVPSDD
jgi:hypothetical protein